MTKVTVATRNFVKCLKILIPYRLLIVNNYFFIYAIFVYLDIPETWFELRYKMIMKSYLSFHILTKIFQAINFRFYHA